MAPGFLRRGVVVAMAGVALAAAAPLAASAANSSDAAPLAAATRTVPAASAAKVRIVLRSGATVLTLNPGTAKALTGAGVAVAPASEARVVKTGISFPITGGFLTPKLVGTIKHSGGLTFTAGGKSLTVRDFVINTGAGKLTAYVDEAHARIPLLDLSLAKATVKAHGSSVVVGNVSATLDAVAAKALDAYYGTTLFKSGLPIGTAKVTAQVTAVRLS